MDGALVLANNRAAGLAFFHVADFVVDRAVGTGDPSQAPFLAQGAGLYNCAVTAGVSFGGAGVYTVLGALGSTVGFLARLVIVRAINPVLPLGASVVGLCTYLEDISVAAGVAGVLALVGAGDGIGATT